MNQQQQPEERTNKCKTCPCQQTDDEQNTEKREQKCLVLKIRSLKTRLKTHTLRPRIPQFRILRNSQFPKIHNSSDSQVPRIHT